MDADFVFARNGRSLRVALVLIAIYAVLLSAIVLVDAAWWLMAALAVPTLPALRDIFANPGAGVRLGNDALQWHSGRRHGRIYLAEIDHMRFDTRWDFSVRVAAVLHNGKRVYLPFEALPPHRIFEAALNAAGLAVKRSHFSFF